MRLGMLKRIDLREYWKHEAHDFTRWLGEPENIARLGDELGIGIQVDQTEASVGEFNVDILAHEENTGRKIIIENQLEKTDHSHLGQLITYAAGLEAEYVIWIVREVREEHRQAVDWLNEHTDEDISFFIVALELWQIGDSDPAPKFAVASRPNEWKKSVQASAQDGELGETRMRQLEFWRHFTEFAAEKHGDLRLRTPRPQSWFDISIGRSDCYLSLVVDSREDQVRCDLYIPDSKDLYRELSARQSEIEKAVGIEEKLIWMELPGKKASRIGALRDVAFANSSTWPDAFAWLAATASRFRRVFARDWSVKSAG
jgi:hypothetical protein